MLIAFFESMKYMGHLWPIALFRMVIGYQFLQAAITRIKSGLTYDPILESIVHRLSEGSNPNVIGFIQTWVLPYWQFFNYLMVFGLMIVGVSYLLGFFVRPAAALAIILDLGFMLATPGKEPFHQLLITIHLMLMFVGAGRCFGFDYYFYKRVRGIWW